MSRRRASRNHSSSSAATSSTHRSGWLRHLLTRASSAGLSVKTSSQFGVESLEDRTLLTTFNQSTVPQVYAYFSRESQVVEISYYNVAFEAVGFSIDPVTNLQQLGNLNTASLTTGGTQPTVGTDLYKIYVTQSSADSYISIYTVNITPTAIVPTPYAGSIPSFSATSTSGFPHQATVPTGTGGVLIGALDPGPTPGPVPISGLPLPGGLGLLPDPNGLLTPGIQVIPLNASTNTPNNFGNFLLGGTVMGTVFFGANVNEFSAGAVLTGNIFGSQLPDISDDAGVLTTGSAGASSVRPFANNFYVAGDLREFLTAGPVGTDNTGSVRLPLYITDFDLSVGGKLGELHVGGSANVLGISSANLDGTVEVGNSPLISYQTPYSVPSTTNLLGNLADQTEWENVPGVSVLGPDASFEVGLTTLRNDTINNAQILGSIPVIDPATNLPQRDVDGNIIYKASVDGETGFDYGDGSDFYAVPMLAGVTFSVSISNGVSLGVFDPDGREIGSNARSLTGVQQYTADRPGLYRFQVSIPIRGTSSLGPYNLTVSNMGNEGIGAISVSGSMHDIEIDSAVICGNGDIGAINVGGTYISRTLGPTPGVVTGFIASPIFASTSILVANGDLRSLIASDIGALVGGLPVYGPTLSIPNGNVGLVRATDVLDTGLLVLSTQFDPNFLLLSTPVMKTDDAYATAIGGFIQDVDAAVTLFMQVGTNKGIGTIHAQNMATRTTSYIDVNADNANFDGIIDLIDVTGNAIKTLGFGILGSGPEFVTHDGGNIRYINIPTGVPIFLPTAFGGEEDQPVTFAAGASQTFTDDSGTTYSVFANGVFTTAAVINASNGVSSTVTTGPQFSTVTYPVLDKSGLIPISITSTGSLTINAASSAGPNSTVDVGSVSFTGIGRAITASTNISGGVTTGSVDANGNPSLSQAVPIGGAAGVTTDAITDTTDEFLSLTGSVKLNVLNVNATVSVVGNSPVAIFDATQGEVVNITTPGIGSITVNGNLGFGTPVATAAAVMPRAVITDGNVYPFVAQHTGVVIGPAPGFGFVSGTANTSLDGVGSALSIQAGGSAGNIQAQGTIQSLVAGAHDILGQFNGIVGPIVAYRLMSVSVGQGLMPTGTGYVGFSGLYAKGKVGAVTNSSNTDGDIRGNIFANEEDPFSRTGIDSISLVNGSIVGSFIGTVAEDTVNDGNFVTTADLSALLVVTQNNSNFGPGEASYVYDVGPITVSGRGGILGSAVATGSIASITVNNGGFGIFTSSFQGQQSGRIGSISASGYGIRNSSVTGVGYLGPVTATGNGSLIPSTRYSFDLRPSDVPYSIDPFSGRAPDPGNDINIVLGTSTAIPNIPNATDTGVIEDDIFNGARDFTSLTAQKSRTAHPLFNRGLINPAPSLAYIPTIGNVFSNSITFGGLLGSVNIKQVTDGFQLTVGQLGSIQLGNDVNRIGISVAGNLKSLVVHGNLGQYITDPESGTLVPDSYVNAGGINGTITSIKVFGNMNANIYATGSIGSILITRDLLGGVLAFAKNDRAGAGYLAGVWRDS